MDGLSPNPYVALDASGYELGAIDVCDNPIPHSYVPNALFFLLDIKELMASSFGIWSLYSPGDIVDLQVANQVACSYLCKQGGRLP